MHDTPKKVIMGKFGSVYGVRGWIRVYSFTEPPENLFNYPQWQIQHRQHWQTMTIEQAKKHGDHFIVKLPNCDNPELARAYTNNRIAINRNEFPELEENTYYWDDLIGLQVITTQGNRLGQVKQFISTGANDIFVVKNGKKHLLPYTKDVIKSINLTEKVIIVDWDPNF